MKHFKLLSSFLVAMLFLVQVGMAQSTPTNPVEQVSPEKALEMAKEGALMIDVREIAEIKEVAYDVESIVNIPLSEFQARMDEVPQDIPVVMVCRSGGRSQSAATSLVTLGYTNILNMEGGITAWQQKGMPVLLNGQTKSMKKCDANCTKACCAKDTKKCDVNCEKKCCNNG